MAAASDKARFYLEQSVPELQEYERKKIFTREEITAITKKRSDFEHILNARGSSPSDYVRYATYEMNLDSLRKKRCKRLGVKSTSFSGQRTIFFILDRATRKFQGDMGLWMQYIQFCQQQQANKKLAKVFTSVLRLKPTEWGLWVLAAKHYAEKIGDMSTARSYMQRGLRFCMKEKKIYLEYFKLEMVYLAKLAARRKVLGLDEERKETDGQQDENDDMIALPEVSVEDLNPEANKGVEEVNVAALQRLASAPAYTGAIPMAIFDAAMKQFNDRADIAENFFDMAAGFDNVPAAGPILSHILNHLRTNSSASAETILCEAKLHTVGVDKESPDFPPALGKVLTTIKSAMSTLPASETPRVAEKAATLLAAYLSKRDQLDESITIVLEATVKRYLRVLAESPKIRKGKSQSNVDALLSDLHTSQQDAEAGILTVYAEQLGLR